MIARPSTANLEDLEDVPPERRAALVDARFADDPILARQVSIWLAACPLDDDPPAFDGAERFELARCVGRGATATVWQAYDRRLARNVALKVFRDAAASRSLAEARASSEVISEHVVRVYDVQAGPPPYLVLELVAERVDGRLELGASAATVAPRDLAEAVRWIRDVAHGVADTHLHDIYHRDLKPQNVLVTPCSRRAKIADFGLATTTTETRVAGTPEYVAPELAANTVEPGRRGLVAIDVWGLGALAYALIGGAPPWTADGATSAWEVAASGRSPPTLHRTPRGELVPPSLRRIVARALARDPHARYPSARAVAAELDAFLASRPTSFDRSPATRLGLWSRRNPQLALTSVVAVALAIVTIGAYATVVRLRRRSDELAADMRDLERERDAIAKRNLAARRELATIEATLDARSRELAGVKASLADTRLEAAALVRSKDRLLEAATLATRRLASEISSERSELATTAFERALYERFWGTARDEARAATDERDGARKERDAARGERDQALASLERERAARQAAEHDLEAAQAAVETLRRDFDARLAASCTRPSP